MNALLILAWFTSLGLGVFASVACFAYAYRLALLALE